MSAAVVVAAWRVLVAVLALAGMAAVAVAVAVAAAVVAVVVVTGSSAVAVGLVVGLAVAVPVAVPRRYAMKLWVVTFTNQLVVLAETAEAAEKIALPHRDDGIEVDGPARPMDHFPSDWDGTSEPYGSDGRTIDDLVRDGLAPELVAMRERLRAATGGAR